MSGTTRIGTCPLCEAMCGLTLEVQDGKVTRVRGDPDDPFSRGHICPKATALPDLQDDPDRVRTPMRRTGSGWEPTDWDTALDAIADGIHSLQAQHGRDSVAAYLGNPNVHNTGAMLFGRKLLHTLGSRNTYSATSVDQLPHMLAAALMFGHELLMPVPDIDRTDLLVIVGANPLVSNGSILTAPDMRSRIDAVRNRGRVVVIDPRRTETARRADAHHFIRPGTDALLLLGVLRVLLTERSPALHHLADHVDGLDQLPGLVRGLSLDTVAERTQVPAETVRELALALYDTERAVLYGRMGVCTQRHGGVAAWLVNVINAVSGHLDREGGMMVTEPALDVIYPPGGRKTGARQRFDRWRSRVRGLPELAGELPVATLAEEIETPGEGQVRGLLVWAGNPVLSTPSGARLDRAMASLELCVAIDLYVTETTRHAHWLLPAAPPLSRDHYDVAFHLLSCRNTARFSERVFEPDGDTREDGAIALALTRRLQERRGVRLRDRLAVRALERLGVRGQLDLGLRAGPHGLGRGGMSLRKLSESPHGIDLGPLRPCLLQRSPLERLQLAPEALVADVPRAISEVGPEGLLLIGRRQLRSNNSWLHNSARLMKGKDRCTLLVHPDDAAAAGVEDGCQAVLSSAAGRVEVPVEVSDTVMPGVVSLPHGFGHGHDGVGWRTAAAHPGVSLNDVTDSSRIDPMSGNAVLNGVPVELSPL